MEKLTKQNGQRCTYYLACFGPEEDRGEGISHKCDYCKKEQARSEKLATYEDMEEYRLIELLKADMKKYRNGIEEKEWVKKK